jgi:hypothetical protein
MHFLKCLLVFIFLEQKLIFDFLEPLFRFWALKTYLHLFDLQKYVFFAPCKISERWIYHTTILILGPNFCFGLWEPIFAFLTPESAYFLHLYTNSDRLMSHMTYFISEPPSAQPSDPADLRISGFQ